MSWELTPARRYGRRTAASSGSDAKVSPTLRQRRDNHAGECFHYDNNKQSKQYPVSYR
jgi:hypothetical protein